MLKHLILNLHEKVSYEIDLELEDARLTLLQLIGGNGAGKSYY